MIKLAIVEDEKEHARILSVYLKNWSRQSTQAVQIQIFEHADAFLFDWDENKDYTAVFLDIQMPKMNGMELARKIRQDSESVQLIFATGISDHMQQGYEVAAMHYLIKPLQESQVHGCMERICRQTAHKKDWILLHGAESVERMESLNIWWVEAIGHSAVVGLEKERIEVTDSLGALEAQLKSGFVKCHRSYLVNLGHVTRIEKTDVVLDNGERIPLSRRLYKQVNEAFIRFYRRGFEEK